MSSRRVAYLVNQYPKTSHSFVRREIRALEQLGWEVRRYSIRTVDEPLVEPEDEAERARTRVLLETPLVPLVLALLATLFGRPRRFARACARAAGLWRRADSLSPRPWAWLLVACVLRRELERHQVGRLHAHFGTNSAAVAMLVRVLGGPPFSFTAHGTASFDAPAAISLPEKIDAACFVVAVCDYGRAQLMRWSPRSKWSKLHVVRCGLGPSLLEFEASAPPATPRFVCVARQSAEKGLAVLLAALSQLRAEGRNFELALVGDGELHNSLRDLATRLGLDGRVFWLGWSDAETVRREILAARALVAPSLAEGLPVVIMEALALRRPVVASAVGGIAELVQDDETGWLVPAGSVEALAGALRRVLEAPVEELCEIADRGRAAVRARHDARAEARRLAELFESVAPEDSP